MHIIVIGAGEVGGYLARILVDEGHDVVVVELSGERAADLDARLDALVIEGTGVSRATLERAEIGKADLVLAVTAVDEVNLVACMMAARCNGRVRTVARVREQPYIAGDAGFSAADLGIDLLISPESAVADEVLGILRYAGSGEIRRLAGGRLILLGTLLGPGSPLSAGTLAEVRHEMPAESLVVAVQGREGLRIPRGGDRLANDERAFVLTLPDHAGRFAELSGRPSSPVKNVAIVGCGNIGFHLARELEKQGISPTIFERDRERAEWLAGKLSSALVLHADGTDPDLLRERIQDDRTDAVVVLIDDAERSLFLGLYAKSVGARKIISRCDKSAYNRLANELGVDATTSPRRAVANAILRYVRRGRVESTVMLGDHEGEILELRVPDRPLNEALVGTPLKELGFPAGSLLGAVIREGAPFIADGKTVLEPGDDLLVVTLLHALHAVERLLS